MQRFISIIMCILIGILTYISIIQDSNKQILFYGNLERNMTATFYIPDNQDICNPEIFYQVISKTAKETSSNIIKTRLVDGTEKGNCVLEKYMLICNPDSRYLQAYDLKSGNMLSSAHTDEISARYCVSSANTNTKEQIGRLNTTMRHLQISLYSFGYLFDNAKANGLYYVDLNPDTDIEQFKSVLKDNIKDICGLDLDVSDFDGKYSTLGVPYTDLTTYYCVFAFILLLFILFSLYYLLISKKHISIMKMMGTKDWSVIKKLFRIPLKSYPIFYLLALLLVFIFNPNVSYAFRRTMPCIFLYGFILVFFPLAYFLLNKHIFQASTLKGKNYATGVLYLQIFAEVICLLSLLYSGAGIYTNVNSIMQQTQKYKNWTIAKDYAVFYPVNTGNEYTSEEEDQRDVTFATALYKRLNQDGALYVDGYWYEDAMIEVNKNNHLKDYQRTIQVNPNYLHAYPVYDTEQQPIEIKEEETDFILLVPETYKSKEAEILNYYQEAQSSNRDNDIDIFQVSPDVPESQKVRIIWTKSNQRIFTFNPNISMDTKGIKDPIIEVLTECNSYICQRNPIRGNANSDALKVKLHGNSKNTYRYWSQTLKDLSINDNLPSLISVNDQAQATLSILQADLRFSIEVLVVLFLTLVYLIYQSTFLIFENKKKDYVVKQMFGASWRNIFGKQCGFKLLLLIAVSGFYLFVLRYGGLLYTTIATLIIIGVQILIMYLCIRRQLSQKRSDVLKGI